MNSSELTPAEHEQRRRRKFRYAYGWFAIVCLTACVVLGLWCVTLSQRVAGQQHQLHQGLCSLLIPASTPLLPKPDKPPSQLPVAWQAWTWQQRYIAVSREFQCR